MKFGLLSKGFLLVAGLLSVLLVIVLMGLFSGHKSAATVAGQVPDELPLEQLVPQSVELRQALADGKLIAGFTAESRSSLKMSLRNRAERPVAVQVSAGLVFESKYDQLVVIRDRSIDLEAGAADSFQLPVASTSGVFSGTGESFQLTGGRVSELAVLIPYIQAHPNYCRQTIQTAILALTENLPLSAFARFDLHSGESAATYADADLKVDTLVIIQALQLLKDIGMPMEKVVLGVDPQLLAEAMIDPIAHAAAMKYYEIPDEQEWEFWQAYLEYGDAATRHYALYGIGQYYPEVAVDMLGQWARAENLDHAMRISAIQSLGKTGKIEALSVLSQLRNDLANDLEMEVAIYQSTELLTQSIYNPFELTLPADFKLTRPDLRQLIKAADN
jgi:hypothetical protein